MKNWKTTATGCVGAAAYAAAAYLQGGSFAVKDMIISVAIAVLGFLAKDFNITGSAEK